jgi:hypothetical protein
MDAFIRRPNPTFQKAPFWTLSTKLETFRLPIKPVSKQGYGLNETELYVIFNLKLPKNLLCYVFTTVSGFD